MKIIQLKIKDIDICSWFFISLQIHFSSGDGFGSNSGQAFTQTDICLLSNAYMRLSAAIS